MDVNKHRLLQTLLPGGSTQLKKVFVMAAGSAPHRKKVPPRVAGGGVGAFGPAACDVQDQAQCPFSPHLAHFVLAMSA
eukprot:1269344-Amphidinium_carterae.1